jgi:hypothetical protein
VVTTDVFGLSVTREVAEESGNARVTVALRCAVAPTRWMPSVAPEALSFLRWVRCVWQEDSKGSAFGLSRGRARWCVCRRVTTVSGGDWGLTMGLAVVGWCCSEGALPWRVGAVQGM